MKLQLTPELLLFLKDQGIRYCFSKTAVCTNDETFNIIITLYPTHSRTSIRQLPLEYDTYFALDKKPNQLAYGVDRFSVLVDLDLSLTAIYVGSLLRPKVLGKVYHE